MIKIAFAVCLSIPFFFRFYFVPRDLPPFPTRRSSDLVLLDAGHNALVLLAIARAIERGLVVRDVAVVQGTCVARTLTARFLCRSEEHTSELQSRLHLVCRLLHVKKNDQNCIRCLLVYPFLFSLLLRPQRSTPFPYTTLFRSGTSRCRPQRTGPACNRARDRTWPGRSGCCCSAGHLCCPDAHRAFPVQIGRAHV